MKTEDVEVDYATDDTGKHFHIVALTKIWCQDGVPFVKFRDDRDQGPLPAHAGGDSREKNGGISKQGGKYIFVRLDAAIGEIRSVISESVVPEPSGFVLATLGIFALTAPRWACGRLER